MKKLFALLMIAVLCGCSSVKEQDTATNPKNKFVQQRIEAVARDLVKSGEADTIEEARPMAEKIVKREIADQKRASRDNEANAGFYAPPINGEE